MIKVNTQTNTASREAVPKALKGLSPDTLINLQSALNPVPPEFIDIEFWPENRLSQTLLDTERFGAEILTPQVKDKVVDVSYVIETKSDEEIQAELSAAKEAKLKEIKVLFNEALLKGLITSSGIKLDISSLIADGAKLAELLGETEMMIRDFDNEVHTLPLNNVQAMIVELSVFKRTLWFNKVNKQEDIKVLSLLIDVVEYDITLGWD